MKKFRAVACVAAGLFVVLGLAWTARAQDSKSGDKSAEKSSGEKPMNDRRVPLAVAQDRARMMHEVYTATLEVMHHRYFRRDGAVLPARALDEVFAEVDRQTRTRSRWIAVNTPAMSVNHEAESDFEKKAVVELSAGKSEYDGVVKGYYQRATPIPLGPGCVGCHTKLFAQPGKTPRVAGLIISIPVQQQD